MRIFIVYRTNPTFIDLFYRYCDECQHSEKFGYNIHVWRGGDGRENVQKTLEDAYILAQINYYNKHIFYWDYLQSYVSFGSRFVADSKCVEGMQATGGPTSKYYCPQTKMSFPELANPHRLLFDSNNKVQSVDTRDYISQEEVGSKFEVAKALYDLVILSRKLGLLSRPAFINYKITEKVKQIIHTNYSVFTLKEGQDRICKLLDEAKNEVLDCMLKKTKEIPIFDDRITLQLSSTSPLSSDTTCSSTSFQDRYKKITVPMLKDMLKERKISFKGKTLRKDLVKLLEDSDRREAPDDSCSMDDISEFFTLDTEETVIDENMIPHKVHEQIKTKMVREIHPYMIVLKFTAKNSSNISFKFLFQNLCCSFNLKEPKIMISANMAAYNDISTLQENICPDYDDENMDEEYKPGKRDEDDEYSDSEDDYEDIDADENGVEHENENTMGDYDNLLDTDNQDNVELDKNNGPKKADDHDEEIDDEIADDDDVDDVVDDNIDDAVDSSGASVSLIDVLKLLKEDTKVTTRSVDIEEIDHWQFLWEEANMDRSLNERDEEIEEIFDDRIANYGNTLWSEYISYSTSHQGRFEINVVKSRLEQIALGLEFARKDSFISADIKDENPSVEADFVRIQMQRMIHLVDVKYKQSVALHDNNYIFDVNKPLDKGIIQWRKIRDYFVVSFAELSPDAMKSVAHILSSSENFGLKSLFSSFDAKIALEPYKGKFGADGQLGRPLLSAYNFFVGETPWGDELHTHIRVLKTFLDRLLTLFVTLAKLKVPGVDFVAFRALCRIHGFEPKEKMFGKGWYFNNLSGDKAVKLLDVIINAGMYLPEPYRVGVIDIAKSLRPLLAVYRSTNPLKEFGYEGIGDGKLQLYNDAIVAPIRVIHRLLGMLFPNIIRYSGLSNKNYCIGWHTRKFEDLIQEHVKQYLSEVQKSIKQC